MDLSHSLLALLGVEHGFGTRFSEGETGRGRGKSGEAVTLRQVHGTTVLKESESVSSGVPASGDGLFSGPGGRPVGVWTADCLPILLSSASGRHVAALHAGWRGAVRGIVHEALARLKDEQGLVSSDLLVVLGPSAGRCCYQVGQEVLSEVSSIIRAFGGGRPLTDIWIFLPWSSTSWAMRGSLPAKPVRSTCVRSVILNFSSPTGVRDF